MNHALVQRIQNYNLNEGIVRHAVLGTANFLNHLKLVRQIQIFSLTLLKSLYTQRETEKKKTRTARLKNRQFSFSKSNHQIDFIRTRLPSLIFTIPLTSNPTQCPATLHLHLNCCIHPHRSNITRTNQVTHIHESFNEKQTHLHRQSTQT